MYKTGDEQSRFFADLAQPFVRSRTRDRLSRYRVPVGRACKWLTDTIEPGPEPFFSTDDEHGFLQPFRARLLRGTHWP